MGKKDVNKKRKKLGLCFAVISALLAAVILTMAGCGSLFKNTTAFREGEVKYIFLFIGDGMGVNHVKAAEDFFGRKMSFQDFPITGLMNTENAEGGVTDSAAGITAMVSGRKTANGVIGKSADLSQEYDSIMELAKEQGFATGIATTAPVNHATPAGFYAHVDSRDNYDEIFMASIECGTVDFLGGGAPLLSRLTKAEGEGLAGEKGVMWIDGPQGLKEITADVQLPVMAAVPGKYSEAYMEAEIDRVILEAKGNKTVSLGDLTKAGISVLENKDKFIFAIESAMVDTACHDNDLGGAVWEVRALDNAVKEALAFAGRHEDETLIIVLADHETGGVSLLKGWDMSVFQKQTASWFCKEFSDQNKQICKRAGISFALSWHTGQPVPVYAYGQGQDTFQGWYENTEIFNKLIEIIKLKEPGV